jgi:hypothetical protein
VTTSAEAAVRDAYGGLSRLALTLTEEQAWLPSGCTGWTLRDLLFHCLADCHRALRALGTPAPPGTVADTDAVSYWRSWRPDPDPAAQLTGEELRWTRVSASAWPSVAPLAAMYAEAAGAVLVSAARVRPDDLVRTQGHTLSVDDLLSTLAVEATVHHLDLVAPLAARAADAAQPGPAALHETRRVLDGLLGRAVPVAWDDVTYALAGTGRRPLTAGERADLDELAAAFPLLG